MQHSITLAMADPNQCNHQLSCYMTYLFVSTDCGQRQKITGNNQRTSQHHDAGPQPSRHLQNILQH